ncbi:MAG: DUF3037 domain-containing protein [Terriglobia bacterium]
MTLKPDKPKQCSLFVVRYVPNVVRNEGLNIGVLLHCPEEKYLGCLFAEDFRRVKRLDSRADLALLRALQEDFERQIEEHEGGIEAYLRVLTGTFSNLIQLEGPRPCLLQDPVADIQQVYRRYVGLGAGQAQPEDARPRIKQRLTVALVEAGVWERLDKRVPAARWTHPGDPFTFDYGYRSTRTVQFLHALSLRRDTQLAKTLAYTLGRVRQQDEAGLTAVVENAPASEEATVLATRSILEEAHVSIWPVAEAAALAHSVSAALAGY